MHGLVTSNALLEQKIIISRCKFRCLVYCLAFANVEHVKYHESLKETLRSVCLFPARYLKLPDIHVVAMQSTELWLANVLIVSLLCVLELSG